MKWFLYACTVILISLSMIVSVVSCEAPVEPQAKPDPAPSSVRYMFEGTDFFDTSLISYEIEGVTEQEMRDSTWFAYLVTDNGYYYSLSGSGSGGYSNYRWFYYWNGSAVVFSVVKVSGPGEEYSEIHVVRLLPGSVLDSRAAYNLYQDALSLH